MPDEIEGCLAVLPSNTQAMRAARQAYRRLDQMTQEDLVPLVMHEYLDQVQADLGSIHNAVARQYFDLHQNIPAEVSAGQ